MGKVNPTALFPTNLLTNNSDKLWYNKNPINFRGHYDFELLKKSYGISNERSKKIEHMLCRQELEASKYMSPDRAKKIQNKLENSSGFIKTTFTPKEFNKLECRQDKFSKTSPNTSAKEVKQEEFVTTVSYQEKKDNSINENTADTKMAKIQKMRGGSLTDELESRYLTDVKNFWNRSNSKNTRSNNRSVGYSELQKALNLDQETQIICEDTDVDNTERAKNEESHLNNESHYNNEEFIIIDKAQYSNNQKQIDVIKEADYQEELMVDDSFSKKKDHILTDVNFISPENYGFKIEGTEYFSPEGHSSIQVNAFDVNFKSNEKQNYESKQTKETVCDNCMQSKYGVLKANNYNSVLSNPTVAEFSPVRSYRYYNNEVFQKLKCFLDKMGASLTDNKRLDEKRACLTLRYDFCLTEIFNMINKRNAQQISLDDLISWGQSNGLNLSNEDLSIILSRYDRDKDECLSFKEFTEIFAPISSEYRKKLNKRSNMKKKKFANYTVQTQKLIKDILQTIIVVELGFLHNNIVACKEVIENSDQVFSMIDINNKGHVDFYDFCVAWQKIESKSAYSSHMLKVLYDQFDRDKDGLISYEELFMPTYTNAAN